VVLELFDKRGLADNQGIAGFTEDDRRLVAAAADFGAEMLRQAMAERQTHRVLFSAVEAALGASQSVTDSLSGSAAERREQPPAAAVLDRLREGFAGDAGGSRRDLAAGGSRARLGFAAWTWCSKPLHPVGRKPASIARFRHGDGGGSAVNDAPPPGVPRDVFEEVFAL